MVACKNQEPRDAYGALGPAPPFVLVLVLAAILARRPRSNKYKNTALALNRVAERVVPVTVIPVKLPANKMVSVLAVAVFLSSTASVATASSAPASAADEFATTPVGRCSTLAPGSPSYRNATNRVANSYRKIGTSSAGRPIWAEHWGSTSGSQVLFIGQIHGDECTPAFLVAAIREKAPSGFGIWLVPTLNPDALNAGTRLTPAGVDINRDGLKLVTPEARALMGFTRAIKPALSVHVHSPYGFIGSRNGGLASAAADAMARSVRWSQGSGSGTLVGVPGANGTAFLWDGQERVIAKHPSILIEMPALSAREAAGAPQPARRVSATAAQARSLALKMRDAMYSTVASFRG